MGPYREWTPNVLSVSRVPSALAFLVVYSNESLWRYETAILLALFALLTDVLDGWLSRRWNVTSELGYFLDGLGDKRAMRGKSARKIPQALVNAKSGVPNERVYVSSAVANELEPVRNVKPLWSKLGPWPALPL